MELYPRAALCYGTWVELRGSAPNCSAACQAAERSHCVGQKVVTKAGDVVIEVLSNVASATLSQINQEWYQISSPGPGNARPAALEAVAGVVRFEGRGRPAEAGGIMSRPGALLWVHWMSTALF